MTDGGELQGLGGFLLEAIRHSSKWAAAELDEEDATSIVAELLDEVAAQRWIEKQMEQTGIRAMEFRDGAEMELEPAREMAALWVGACRGLLNGGANYSETVMDLLAKPGDKVSMTVKLAEAPAERYVITVQRDHPGAITPHQARERAEGTIGKAWQWIADVNDGLGYDVDDLIRILEQNGFPPSEGKEGRKG